MFDKNTLTNAQVKQYVKRFKNLSADSKDSAITEISSLKQILKKGGTYYKPYQNGLATVTFIFGTAKPSKKQKTKANNALKKGCDYLHKNFNQYFYFLTDWVITHIINTSVSTNLTGTNSFTTSASFLSVAVNSFLNLNTTQEKIDEIVAEYNSILLWEIKNHLS